MNRIKQAWLVLTGRAQALDVSQGRLIEVDEKTANLLISEAERYGTTERDHLFNALEHFSLFAGPALDDMANEMDLGKAVSEVIRKAGGK